jgi:hypothetical protein
LGFYGFWVFVMICFYGFTLYIFDETFSKKFFDETF